MGKAGVVVHTSKPSAWGAKTGVPGAFSPSNLAKLMIYLKKQDGGQSRKYPILTSVLHVLLYTYAHTYMNTFGAGGKRKKEVDEEEDRRSRGGGNDG